MSVCCRRRSLGGLQSDGRAPREPLELVEVGDRCGQGSQDGEGDEQGKRGGGGAGGGGWQPGSVFASPPPVSAWVSSGLHRFIPQAETFYWVHIQSEASTRWTDEDLVPGCWSNEDGQISPYMARVNVTNKVSSCHRGFLTVNHLFVHQRSSPLFIYLSPPPPHTHTGPPTPPPDPSSSFCIDPFCFDGSYQADI